MNINGLLSTVKNHELVILSSKELRELLGVKRLTTDVINELSEELGLLGYVLIPIRYNSSSNGLTDVRKVVIVRKNTYLKIVREKDRNAIARAIIDYVLSNKHLFTANIKGDGNVLKIPTSIIRRLLKYLNLSNQYIDTRMGSIVLTIRTLLEVSGFTTELKRAMGRMNSIIYAYEDSEDGNPRVPEAGERLKNPPTKPKAGEGHDGNPTWSNPSKVRENKEEGANHEELKVAGAGPNGTVGTAPRVRGSVGREGGRHSNTEVQNSEGGREGTTATQGGGGE
jgi:hypothetical protein